MHFQFLFIMKKKVLIIEDDPLLGKLYERALFNSEIDVSLVTDGASGIVESRSKPDIILLDIMLPDMNGIDVLKALRNDEKTKDVPVIILSNLSERAVVKEGYRLGVKGYLLKVNILPKELVGYVNHCISEPNTCADILPKELL